MYMTLVLANFLTTTLAIAFIFVAIFMILVVLIQKPKGGGLSGAFGGGGGGDHAVFGAKAGDVVTWITVCVFIAFIGLGIGLVYATRAESVTSPIVQEQAQPATQPDDADAGAGTGADGGSDTGVALPEFPENNDAQPPQAPRE